MSYIEIDDQAGFFASVWGQLPEVFRTPTRTYGEVVESCGLIIWNCTKTDVETTNQNPKEDESDIS